jgi:hypothetical protein
VSSSISSDGLSTNMCRVKPTNTKRKAARPVRMIAEPTIDATA